MTYADVPFLDAITDASAGNKKIPQSAFLAAGPLPVVDQGQALIAGYTNDLSAEVSASLPVIVFGDHTRAFKFVDFPFAMGADGVKVLSVRDGFDPKFVFRWLQSRTLPSAGYSRHYKFLKEVEVPKPPPEEQRRIAAILDQADALRAKRRQVLAHLAELVQSVFDDMFGRLEDWPFVPLGCLAVVTTGKTPPTAVDGMFGGRIPFVTPGDLGSGRPAARTVTEAGATASRVVRAGSTLVCCIGATIGKIDMAHEESALNQQINAVEWGGHVDDFYGLAAMSRIKPTIVARGASTTLPLLPKGQFVKLELPVPPLDLQREFAARVRVISNQRTIALNAANAHDELFASVQSRAFRGEL